MYSRAHPGWSGCSQPGHWCSLSCWLASGWISTRQIAQIDGVGGVVAPGCVQSGGLSVVRSIGALWSMVSGGSRKGRWLAQKKRGAQSLGVAEGAGVRKSKGGDGEIHDERRFYTGSVQLCTTHLFFFFPAPFWTAEVSGFWTVLLGSQHVSSCCFHFHQRVTSQQVQENSTTYKKKLEEKKLRNCVK